MSDLNPQHESFLDHPEVKALMENINKITTDLDSLSADMEPLEQQIAAIDVQKDDYMEKVRAELLKYDEQKRAINMKRLEIQDQLRAARDLKNSLDQQVKQKIDAVIAEQTLAAAEQRFDMLMETYDWYWKEQIRPFQLTAAKAATKAVLDGYFGFAILDQMGLGKTLEATATLDMIQGAWREALAIEDDDVPRPYFLDGTTRDNAVLWVCPASIKVTTEREIAKWSPNRAVVQLEGNPMERASMLKFAHMAGAVVIASYEQLRDRKGKPVTPELFSYQWPIVVLDEAHRFKNDESSTFSNVEVLCKKAGAVIPMTGTPIMNRPDEFWALLHMLTLKGVYEGKFAQKWRFINEYCYTYGYNGSQHSFQGDAYDRLIRDVKDIVIRRRKDEVAIELPDKERILHLVEMTYDDERTNYDAMRDSFAIMVDEDDKEYISANSILAVFTRLRQLALWQPGVKITRPDGTEKVVDCYNSSKIDRCMEIVQELLDNDEKVLVFSNYNEALKEVQRRVQLLDVGTDLIIGGQDAYKRADIVDKFNDSASNLRVLGGNITAMGVGLNLQGACSNAIFLDSGWNPGVNEQAEDRLHRGGQTSNVMIHYIQALDTIDGFIAKKVEDKANMIEGIIERSELRRALDEGLI